MAYIYNERMYQYYKYGHLSRDLEDSQKYLYKSQRGSWAEYTIDDKCFRWTLGWKGNDILFKEFGVRITEEQYKTFIRKWDMLWVYRKKKQRRNFYNRHRKELVLIKLTGGI